MVLHLVLGDDPLFHVPAYHLVHPLEFAIYAVLGVVGGLGSVAFVKLLLKLRELFMRMPEKTVWLQPAIGGLSVGLIGYFVPQVMGVGYDYVEKVLNGDLVLQLIALLAVLKIVATAVCYSSGNAGGIFGPSLFIGAMLGGTVGSVAHHFLPAYTAGPGAYALVGMGAAFAGIVRTPLTSVIMIFEMTRDYSIIVPLMISNLIAFFISQSLQKEPIYEALANQDGVHLPTADSRSNHARMRIIQVMRPPAVVLPYDSAIASTLDRIKDQPLDAWPVVDGRGLLLGMVRQSDLKSAVSGGRATETLAALVGAADGTAPSTATELPHLHTDHTLGLALERMGTSKLHVLPVVSRANIRQILGIAVLEDVLDAFGVGRPAKPAEYSE
jgi:CIC family chloride channel protein